MEEAKNLPAKKDEAPMDLANLITHAIKIPGVKVTREYFLREMFKDLSKEEIELIVEKGPVVAGRSREELKKKAARLIKDRTAVSSFASFVAGIPGGLAMAATIPADMLQFYGVALRMAQELVYLYGEEDMWCEGAPDPEKVTNQLILYCGVMLGASGAAQAVRVMTSALAKQALKKLPQQALTKTFYYPVIKAVLKFFGVNVTKSAFAKGVSKALPVVGGFVSGGITLASMLPMGNRLLKALDTAHFDYDTEDFEEDMETITEIGEQAAIEEEVEQEKIEQSPAETIVKSTPDREMTLQKIREAKQLLDEGIITEEEFAEIKSKLISEIQ